MSDNTELSIVSVRSDSNDIKQIIAVVGSDACLHIKTVNKDQDQYVRSQYPKDPRSSVISFGIKITDKDGVIATRRVYSEVNETGHILKIDTTLDENCRPHKKKHYCFFLTVPAEIDLDFHRI